MPYLEPLAIEADDKLNRLFIEWSEGHTTEHDIAHLRWLCPCAECKGEWGDPGKLAYTKELTPKQTELTDVHPVGRYGLTPVWADGHTTGIYTYDYLRKNCECAACLAQRAAEEAAATP